MAERFDQCDDSCTVDCGHCKGRGRPTVPVVTLPRDFARRFHAADEQVERAKRKRDALVLEAKESASLREIADALDISHTMVAKIIKRAENRG